MWPVGLRARPGAAQRSCCSCESWWAAPLERLAGTGARSGSPRVLPPPPGAFFPGPDQAAEAQGPAQPVTCDAKRSAATLRSGRPGPHSNARWGSLRLGRRSLRTGRARGQRGAPYCSCLGARPSGKDMDRLPQSHYVAASAPITASTHSHNSEAADYKADHSHLLACLGREHRPRSWQCRRLWHSTTDVR